MNYKECVDYIQNAALFGSKKDGLANIAMLLDRLGNPQSEIPMVHIAGTNGKGSVCAYMESALRKKYKTGLFTSPYLQEFTERIRINGRNIDKDEFTDIANAVISVSKQMQSEGRNHPTFFEMITAVCFEAFRRAGVEMAVVETGMGGRLDATNVIDPLLCVITEIGYDHEKVLGSTIEEIAGEKAGIIKRGRPVVIYPQESDPAYAVLLQRAKAVDAPLYAAAKGRIALKSSGLDGQVFDFSYQDIKAEIKISLLGRHQVSNAATAFLALCVLTQNCGIKLSEQSILQGLAETVWPGRMELISREPYIIIDGAHNPQGMARLNETISALFPLQKPVVVFGVLATKNVEGMCRELVKLAGELILTEPDSHKALDTEEIKSLVEDKIERVSIQHDIKMAIEHGIHAAVHGNLPLCVCGSLYLVGRARTLLLADFSCEHGQCI